MDMGCFSITAWSDAGGAPVAQPLSRAHASILHFQTLLLLVTVVTGYIVMAALMALLPGGGKGGHGVRHAVVQSWIQVLCHVALFLSGFFNVKVTGRQHLKQAKVGSVGVMQDPHGRSEVLLTYIVVKQRPSAFESPPRLCQAAAVVGKSSCPRRPYWYWIHF